VPSFKLALRACRNCVMRTLTFLGACPRIPHCVMPACLGILILGALESALQHPRMTFGGDDLYATLAEKAAALAF
jgi:hypothetical protein